ncbi:MAG: hypothetical protein U0990_06885 [Candidatus Nanopelagicales bacterium]|nr:hypothetical protein [Candidatus Nanopelagicales bacterium]MDZ4249801.1 hypothetical protein [Candidatus Nanopelagicales bacterium]
MVPTARLIRVLLVPLLGAVLVLSGCSRGPDSAEAALYDYEAAVNARDRGALERLFADEDDPSAWADWVLNHAPAGTMEMREFRIEMRGIPHVIYAWVKWNHNGGVPKDGAFVLGRGTSPDGSSWESWSVGFLNEGPGVTPPKTSRSPTRK